MQSARLVTVSPSEKVFELLLEKPGHLFVHMIIHPISRDSHSFTLSAVACFSVGATWLLVRRRNVPLAYFRGRVEP